MLRKLTVENFYSILDPQTLDLHVARNATDPDGRFTNPIGSSDPRLPKVVAIFGANASGKTNILRVIAFLVNFVKHSSDIPPGKRLPFLEFLGEPDKERKTKFSVQFDTVLFDWEERVLFQYDLEVGAGGLPVIRESLKYYPRGRSRKLFERTGDRVDAGSDFELSRRDPVRGKIRDNTSVISILTQFNHAFSSAIYEALDGLQTNVSILGRHEASNESATTYYNVNPDAFVRLNAEIAKMDFGIERVVLETARNEVEPWFYHQGVDEKINIRFESQGTQRFYSQFPKLYYVLETGGVAVLDELDNDIHPLLLPEIIQLFQNKETNPYEAQLIMSCHNATLLEHLVKEEIYFTEKDNKGKTQIYGLKDVKGVRRDTNIYAKYLAGVFGAVPKVA